MVKIECANDGMNVVCPHSRISVDPGRLSRKSMTAQVYGNEPEGVSHVGAQLTTPGHAALRKSVDEHDGSTLRVARLDRVQLNSAAPDDLVVLQHVRTPHAGFEHRRVNAERYLLRTLTPIPLAFQIKTAAAEPIPASD